MASGCSQALNFSSDNDSDSEDFSPKQKKKKILDWVLLQTFQPKAEAEQFLKGEKQWAYDTKSSSKIGNVIRYECRVSKNCSAKRRFVFVSTSLEVICEKTDAEHDHNPKPEIGILSNIKDEIILIYKDGITKPKMILSALRRKGLAQPHLIQLKNFLHYYKTHEVSPVVSLGALEALCNKHEKQPTSVDEPFVIHKEFDYEQKWFGFFVSTQRLMQLTELTPSLHSDATYKLSWQGFPVLLVGVSDKDRVFHPISIGVTSGETDRDFALLFAAIKKGASPGYNPKFLIADTAEAITNGFISIFGSNFKRGHCYFHLTSNIDKKQSLVTKGAWKEIRLDITTLQLARTTAEFNAAATLWSKKYATSEPIFHDYFVKEHIQTRINWYEGFAPGYASSNNGLESTNKVIKSHGTFRERLPMAELFRFFLRQVEEWSFERNPDSINCKIFAKIPTITLKIETEAFNWIQSKPDIRFKTISPQIMHHLIAATGSQKLKEEDVVKYQRMQERNSWRSFDTYKKQINRLWLVTFDNNDWTDFKCTCKMSMKQYICKHIVGLSIKNEKYSIRPEAKTIPLGEKRRRGRPTKANKALLTL